MMRHRKAKLRAQLAQAHNIWRGAKDDQEGQNRRRYAYQVALGAVWEYVKNDAPSEHLYLLGRLAEHLDDLNLGRQPKELKPALRLKRGNRGLRRTVRRRSRGPVRWSTSYPRTAAQARKKRSRKK